MARGSTRSPILDKNHGFMKYIIRNQIDRDNFDKEQKMMQKLRSLNLSEDKPNSPSPMNGRFSVVDEDKDKEENISRTSIDGSIDGDITQDHCEYSDNTENYNETNDKVIFNLEFLTKIGDILTIKVHNTDSPEEVVERIDNEYPLQNGIKNALLRRVNEEMTNLRSPGL